MSNQGFLVILFGGSASVLSLYVLAEQGLALGIAFFLITFWILFNLTTEENVLNALGTVFNPLHTAINFFLISFAYLAYIGAELSQIAIWSTAYFFVGLMVSMVIYKYWNIAG